MTTMTLTGISLTYGAAGNVTAFSPFTFVGVFPDNQLIANYSIISSPPNELPEVNISGTEAYSATINGLEIPFAYEDHFGAITSAHGTHILYILYDPATGTDNIMFVGGDPLPPLTTVSEINAFNAGITSAGAATGVWGPGVNIPLTNFSGATFSEDDTIVGTTGNDILDGGLGNDTIDPLTALNGGDRVFGSVGNDTVIYTNSGANPDGWQELLYSNLAAGITANINGGANSASVDKGINGIDTITDIATILDWNSGGFNIYGTGSNDTFNIDTQAATWMAIYAGGGNDSFNITSNGIVRLTFNWDGVNDATTGVVMDIGAGTISNDGFGGADTIALNLGASGRLEIQGTNFNDTIVGSAGVDRFILNAGNDTVDGAGGVDLIRYDRNGVTAVTVDLAAGTATGMWGGIAFTHTLSNIEDIRGSRNDNDTLSGNASANRIDGRGGDDTINGREGNDYLIGGDGNDTLDGGTGFDQAYFSGVFANYTVTTVGGVTTVTDGTFTDTLTNIEEMQFDDQTVSLVVPNIAPLATLENLALAPLEWNQIGNSVVYSDADGDSATQYEIIDNSGGNNFWIQFVGFVDASSGYVLSAAQLGQLWVRGDGAGGTQTLQIRAHDGTEWGAWDSFDLTTSAANTAPVATLENLSLAPLEWNQIGNSVTYSDADGDTAVQYEVMDNTGANSFWLAGVGTIDATSGYTLSAAQLSGLWVRGDGGASVQTMQIRAYDGTDWGTWDTFDLTTQVANTAPVATLENLSVAPNAWDQIGNSVVYSDADSDAATQYQVWDSSGGNNFWVQYVGYVDASSGYTISASQLSALWVQGDSSAGSQTLWIRANDGTDWGAWDGFDLTTAATNTAPTATQGDISVNPAAWNNVGTSVVYADSDADPAVQYEIWDSQGGNNFWVQYVGTVDASSGYTITAGQLAGLWVQGDPAAGSQTLWIRANDGTDWGAWDSFDLTTL